MYYVHYYVYKLFINIILLLCKIITLYRWHNKSSRMKIHDFSEGIQDENYKSEKYIFNFWYYIATYSFYLLKVFIETYTRIL